MSLTQIIYGPKAEPERLPVNTIQQSAGRKIGEKKAFFGQSAQLFARLRRRTGVPSRAARAGVVV